MRGYSRRAVDEAVAALRLDLRGLEDGRRDMEDRLSQALDEMERLKLELSAARSSGRPPHEEISERIGQILKLADDEAKSQRTKAEEEIAKLRADAKAETDQAARRRQGRHRPEPGRGAGAGRAHAERRPGAGRQHRGDGEGRGGERPQECDRRGSAA